MRDEAANRLRPLDVTPTPVIRAVAASLKCPGVFVHSLSQQHVVSDDEQHARNDLAMP